MYRIFSRVVALLATSLFLISCTHFNANDVNVQKIYEDGKNLNDWNLVGNANWRLQKGSIQADFLSSKLPSYLVTKTKSKDFHIYTEFWADSQTNSGVFIRCQNPEKIDAVSCYEVNIWDARPDPSYGTAAIVDVAKVTQPYPKAGGQWNTMEITANGSNLIVKFNGVETVNTQNDKLKDGFIALQYGSGIIKFRKFYMKQLN
ncbi:3-keto-disaccharide hydrolase [Polynucleobacter kasalickyi]|uniref:3-keto-alpha-glucoside-1,2-lyase/3-keto-2-hydroxy-glucal hydratase domain-containing protein n=1 Tax=Polynucleobacter kasalickyi TaxID=1938817 RepID=A0A1W1YLD7_9BURK|nr:DUF1080 domain-containing protein [Polynucleobacter kasalickyi]SMC36621.1 protein of unknown function [Polynucleobacter kasalickyi]